MAKGMQGLGTLKGNSTNAILYANRYFVAHMSFAVRDLKQAETDAVNSADATKRQGYFRSMGKDDKVFDGYCRLGLNNQLLSSSEIGPLPACLAGTNV